MTTIQSTSLNERYYHAVHSSGLPVYAMPRPGFSKSYAILVTRYGSIDSAFTANGTTYDVPDGIAHFLEHKLFDQPDGSNVMQQFTQQGASPNAFTSSDKTAYLFSCTDMFYENLDLLLSYVYQPYFTDESVAKEQGIIGQEIQMYRDHPQWRMFFGMTEIMYKDHPVRKDIAGTIESIGHITKELLYACHATFYHPSNMLLFTIGDVDMDAVLSYCDKRVPQSAPLTIERRYPTEQSAVYKSEALEHLSVANPLFCVGYKDASGYAGKALHERNVVTNILIELLFGKSSAFYEELYNQGLINNGFSYEYEAVPMYAYTALMGESTDPYAVRDAIARTAKAPVITDEALNKVKKSLIGRYLRQFNGVEWLANNIMSMLLYDINVFDYIDLVGAVTVDTLMARAAEHFTDDKLCINVVAAKA